MDSYYQSEEMYLVLLQTNERTPKPLKNFGDTEY